MGGIGLTSVGPKLLCVSPHIEVVIDLGDFELRPRSIIKKLERYEKIKLEITGNYRQKDFHHTDMETHVILYGPAALPP